MPSTRVFKPSFAGGEISPEMFGRVDDAKYATGAAVIQNLITTPLGPAEKRPGFQYVNATKNNGTPRLIPFTYSPTQTMVIECGAGYFRFYTMGARLLYSATQRAFVPQGLVTFTVANPTVVSWPTHGLVTGDLVTFGISPVGGPNVLPTGISPTLGYTVTVIDANTFHITDPTTSAFAVVTVAGTGTLCGIKVYTAGELCSYGGWIYYCYLEFFQFPGGTLTPATAIGYFNTMPADLTYEIPNSYAAADLMSIHYVQSNDVITLTHPNYPPMELRRMGAANWSLVPSVFGQALAAPTGVAVTASPGYLAQIASISIANPAMFTTVSNHTLAMGDGVYVKGLTVTIAGVPTVLDGFYLVNSVPVSGTGALIPNELTLMDYSGNVLNSTGWTSPSSATIQYGSKIFNIVSQYVVTAIMSDGVQESAISSPVSVLNNLNVTGSFNTITWTAVPGAFRYQIYKQLNGLYGYIGTTASTSLTFVDNNIACDMSITPPMYDPVFNSTGNYPGAVAYFQQRKWFGGTSSQPQNLWGTKSGTESDMSYSLPVLATDRVAIGIATREMSTIQHIVPLLQLLLLTSSSELSVSPTNSDVITPTSIDPRPQSYIGASSVQPSVVNNSMIYCANRGGHVRECGYQWQIGGYVTGDISLRAGHLFDNLAIIDQAFMKAPWQIVWFVSSNGNLLGLTYIPEEQIGAWHHHVTDGKFLSITVVAEGAEDRLYAVIQRVVNGQTVNYIERMSTRNFDTTEDCFFVDSGATYDGTNTSSTTVSAGVYGPPSGPLNGTYHIDASAAIFSYPAQTDVGSFIVIPGSDGNQYRFRVLNVFSTMQVDTLGPAAIPAGVTFGPTTNWSWARSAIGGLTWLEGKTVSILADGAVQPQAVVTNGTVWLQHPSTIVTIGLPYIAGLKTLPLTMQIDAQGQGRTKNLNKVWLRLYQSSAVFAGPSSTALVEYKQRTTEPYGSPPDLVTDEVEITIPAGWQTSGQVYIQQTDPLPLTLVGLTVEAVIGG